MGMLAVFLMSEIVLRSIGYYYVPIKIKKLDKGITEMGTDFRQHHSQEDSYFVFDPVLIWHQRKTI